VRAKKVAKNSSFAILSVSTIRRHLRALCVSPNLFVEVLDWAMLAAPSLWLLALIETVRPPGRRCERRGR
jgi:hypothetical protein